MSVTMDTARPRAVLLDLDDTIIDFGSSAEPAWRAVCAEAAAQTPGMDDQALFTAIQEAREWYWSDPDRHREGRADLRAASCRIVDQALRTLGFDLPALARTTADRYRNRREAAVTLFPQAVESLERLRASGTRLGLVTNGTSRDQRAKIERFDLAQHFDYILIEGEFGCGKPDERVYRAAMEALRVQPVDAWFVGDNLEWDVAAPQRLGLYTVWIDAAGAGLPADAGVKPHRIIYSLADL